MNWLRALGLAAAVVSAGLPLRAETLIVKSGEHDRFSRLVMLLPDGAKWNLASQGRTARLSVDVQDVLFETSDVFDRIPRTRLKSLAQKTAGSPLEFELDCFCEVSGFMQDNRFLVIDIANIAPREASAGTPPPPLMLPVNQLPYRFSGGPTAELRHPVARFERVEKVTFKAPENSSKVDHLPLVTSIPQSAIAPRLPDHQIDLVGRTRQRLFEQIGRASTQGLLDAYLARPPKDGITPLPGTGLTSKAASHVMVTTSVDRGAEDILPSPGMTDVGTRCLSSSQVEISRWANDTSFSIQIADLRAGLFGEFDRLNVDTALKLVKVYAYFGFSVEAESLLNVMPVRDQETDLLRAIAQIMDDVLPKHPNPLTGQQTCGGIVALWAVLAEGSPEPGLDTASVQRAFSELPLMHRRFLGPRISRIFADAGEDATAAGILRAVERSGGAEQPAVELAQAAIARSRGNSKAETAHLETVAESGSVLAVDAVVKLVEAHLRNETALPPDFLDLVAALAMENRSGSKGAELRRARTLALASMGQFEEAFASLEDLRDRDGKDARNAVMDPFLALMADRAQDIVFLKYALDGRGGNSEFLSPSTSELIAKRLLDLGFAEAAMQILDRRIQGPVSETHRLLKARAAMSLGKPHRAMVEILGLTGSEADRLRASAMWMNEDYTAAGELLLAANDSNAAARSFWLSQDFAEIQSGDAGKYAEAAEQAQRLAVPESTASELPPLARARALVEDSSETRDQVLELLSGMTVQTEKPGSIFQE